MEAYSMDLRRRVIADSDEGLGTTALAKKYRVSESWVRNLKRWRRESGQIGPRPQRVHHETKLDDHLERLQELVRQQPDATLAELREQLGVEVSVSTIWRVLNRLQMTFKKRSSTPPNKIGPTSKLRGLSGRPR
jgi:transposase